MRNIGQQRGAQRQLRLFLAGSVLLALVAAANVSLFLLARAPGRRRELAIRMSVGAPLRRIARQLTTESALLVLVGGALGVLISLWLENALRGLAFLREAEWTHVTLLDWRVLGLIGIFLLILMLLVSLAPVAGLKRLRLATSGQQAAARATLGQRVAGTVQIAIAGAFTAAAISFGWVLGTMIFGSTGFAIDERYLVQFEPSYADLSSAIRTREAVESIPGVHAFTVTSLIPGRSSDINTRRLRHPMDPTREINVGYGTVDSRYIDVLEMQLLHGRSPTDDEGDVTIVNRALALRMFGRENAVGEILDLTAYGMERVEVVGVLADVSLIHPSADVDPILFVQPSRGPNFMTGVVHGSLGPAELQRRLQDLVDSGALEDRRVSVDPLERLKTRRAAS